MTQTATRTCPSCSTALSTILHEGVELDRCPDGHGLWLDRGELLAVTQSREADRPAEEEHAALAAAARDAGHAVVAELDRPPRLCPVCSDPMRIVEYGRSGIAIDECSPHGAWLDDGELERIEAYSEGLQEQARGGAASDAARLASVSIVGLDVPADLLASIRTTVPPPA